MIIFFNYENFQASVAQTCNPGYSGAKISRIVVRDQSRQKVRSFLKNTQYINWGVAQAVDHLLCKREALSSNLSTSPNFFFLEKALISSPYHLKYLCFGIFAITYKYSFSYFLHVLSKYLLIL
jgi:hypothetical protein